MVLSIFGILLISPSVLSQFASFEANDMTEERLAQDQYFRQAPIDEDDEYRRTIKQIAPPILTRRYSDADFAYHDKMDSNEGGTMQDFEQNLKHFMNDENLKSYNGRSIRVADLQQQGSRRTGNPDDENNKILTNYALPIAMTVDGYLRVPIH